MKDLKDVDLSQLKVAIKALNDSGLIEPKIKTIGKTKEQLVEAFTQKMDDIVDNHPEKTDSIPDPTADMWNFLYGDAVKPETKEEEETKVGEEKKPVEEVEKVEGEEEGEEEEEKIVPTPIKLKTPKVPKAPKEPKPPREKKVKVPKELSRYGHQVGSQSAQMDDAIFEGISTKEVEAKMGLTPARLYRHVLHLRNDKGIVVDLIDNVYKVHVPEEA